MTQRTGSTDRSRIYHYRIDLKLGQGGTGSVYRGIDSRNGAVVALKVFHANFFSNRLHIRDLAKSVQRFRKFEHNNIVRIYDFITGEEGEVLVEEYVDGPDLKWYMPNRAWNLGERLVIAAQICNGLQYINDQGFIHHDLKPGNILFTRKGMVKVADYSLVRQTVLGMFGAGLSEQVTPMYVAPELILKQKATVRSDIYSLGITFYQLFTEKLPFFEQKVDNLQKLYFCHIHAIPIHPTKVNPKCPPVLGDIIMRMIDKKPENRFENADLLRITLAEVGRSRI